MYKVDEIYSALLDKLPVKLLMVIGFLTEGAFIYFPFVSILGLFLAYQGYKCEKRKLSIFAIILNSFNFILSLFIAWLLFGLARGM